MHDISWPCVLLVTVLYIEFRQASLLKCGYGKEDCRRSGSCQRSLNCKMEKYKDSDCVSEKADPGSYRLCDNSRNCYMEIDHCDGIKDCMDGADERDCCPAGSRRCDFMFREMCYTEDDICDGHAKCWDDSDEKNCTKCKSFEKLCDRGTKCYSSWETCDGISNCLDNKDEQDCSPEDTNYKAVDESGSGAQPYIAASLVTLIAFIAIFISYKLYTRRRDSEAIVTVDFQTPTQQPQFQSTHSYMGSGLPHHQQERNALLGVHGQNQHGSGIPPTQFHRSAYPPSQSQSSGVPTGQPQSTAYLPRQLGPTGQPLHPGGIEEDHRNANREGMQPSAPLLPPEAYPFPTGTVYPPSAPVLPPGGATFPTSPSGPTGGTVPYTYPPGSLPAPPPSSDTALPPPSYDMLFPQK